MNGQLYGEGYLKSKTNSAMLLQRPYRFDILAYMDIYVNGQIVQYATWHVFMFVYSNQHLHLLSKCRIFILSRVMVSVDSSTNSAQMLCFQF